MLNLKFIQENKETVIERLAVKNFDARHLVEKIITLDGERKKIQQLSESKQAQMNSIAREIGALMKNGKKEEAEKARLETTELKEEIECPECHNKIELDWDGEDDDCCSGGCCGCGHHDECGCDEDEEDSDTDNEEKDDNDDDM